jgi:hypothetical protein
MRKDASRLTLLDVADEGAMRDMGKDDDYRRVVTN